MSTSLGCAVHSITDGRLTLKKPHLEYLGNPQNLDISLGPGKALLIHVPERRAELVELLLGNRGVSLDNDQFQVARRLHDMAETVPVDEQGRLRIPAALLKWAELTDKSVKAQVVPAYTDGWLELYSESKLEEMLLAPIDPWREAFDRLVRRRREEQSNEQ